MTFLKILIISLISISCSSKNSLNQFLKGRKDIQISTLSFSTHEEAKTYIERKKKFFNMLFEQHVDPYYGTPRWSEECLSENEIGPIVTTQEVTYISANLIANEANEPGFCSKHNFRPLIFVSFTCKNSKNVTEMKIPPPVEIEEMNLCD